jgi:hypothetical protein
MAAWRKLSRARALGRSGIWHSGREYTYGRLLRRIRPRGPAAARLARDVADTLPGANGSAVHYLRTSQTLSPEALAFYPRSLGSSRANAYPVPGAGDRLAGGLPVLSPPRSRSCARSPERVWWWCAAGACAASSAPVYGGH